MGPIWDAVVSAFTAIITLLGTFLTSLTSETGALKDLLPLFAVGIAVSCILLAVKIVRRITWGA